VYRSLFRPHRSPLSSLHVLLALALLVSGLLLLARPQQARAAGPGLTKITFSPSEVFTPISMIQTTTAGGVARGNGLATMHKGYLAVPYGRDSGQSGGGFAFYDISNPRSPQLVSRYDRTELREAHGFARINRSDGRSIW
jgi:hypothetical protein